jgi:hypothetical protein
MKKIFFLPALLILASTVFTSCDSNPSSNNEDKVDVDNSEIFNKVVFAEGGDFVGISLGDSKDDVKANLPKDAFEDETESYLYYAWNLDGNDYYLDLYFREDNTLSSIDGFVYFYDEETYYDEASATEFYDELKTFFINKLGSDYEEVGSEYTYVYWAKDKFDVEVGQNEGEVYWYFYGYETSFDDIYEAVEEEL